MGKATIGKGPSRKIAKQKVDPETVIVEKVIEVEKPIEIIKEVVVEKPVEYQMVDVSSSLSQLVDEEVDRIDNRLDEIMSEVDALHNKVQKEDNSIRNDVYRVSNSMDNLTKETKLNKMKLSNHEKSCNTYHDKLKQEDKKLANQVKQLQIACGVVTLLAFIGWFV